MKGVLAFVAVVLLAFSIGLTVGCVAQNISVNNDVNAWLTRAQVAADIEDMMIYLDRAEQGLDDRNMNSGHSGVVIKNAANDFTLIRQNIDRIQERAGQLSKTPVEQRGGDAAYQQGLDDLRGTLRELSVPAEGYYWRHDGLLYLISVWFVWALLVVVAIIAGYVIFFRDSY